MVSEQVIVCNRIACLAVLQLALATLALQK